ncbi:hypothetical protein E2C01_062167 [Portunus trituberculatus]|uniref:Uncharacterized protein n=1 Tax=Portunus trituberculatus TaxID=210409 RepID=A0A5B7HGC6_PORTR|nr:hypothetical protein [Portunus trituberculatus]
MGAIHGAIPCSPVDKGLLEHASVLSRLPLYCHRVYTALLLVEPIHPLYLSTCATPTQVRHLYAIHSIPLVPTTLSLSTSTPSL